MIIMKILQWLLVQIIFNDAKMISSVRNSSTDIREVYFLIFAKIINKNFGTLKVIAVILIILIKLISLLPNNYYYKLKRKTLMIKNY